MSLRAVELARRTGDIWSEAQSHAYAWVALGVTGKFAEMRLHAVAGLALGEKLRDSVLLGTLHWYNACGSFLHGEWAATLEFLDRSLQVAPNNPRRLATRMLLEYGVGDFEAGDAAFVATVNRLRKRTRRLAALNRHSLDRLDVRPAFSVH